ncbi:TlpA disulfide reductase family protein [Pseudobacter ginsenosidimutans]|uniref:Peroxiredoxin n=1 Tax=Pseudobacter ginsenosidimutans TaxID=661488 RepID=A0A4V2F216_9BACT|nr:TlpA disulfide reductase family protein [Pseudobacter ginsenosidimutans]QEC44247.1 AhpC/TSA family protein [Pseudobacter ginsenosidimutans]RZS75707.1 peroxiredoxin [Pseudobacter ginsenosidimutans]
MMKRIWMLQVLILLVIANATAQKFKLNGKLGKKAEGQKLMLSWQKGNTYHADSAIVKNGKFTIAGELVDPVKGYLRVVKADADEQQDTDNAELFLEPGNITLIAVNGRLGSATIKGGPGQSDFIELQKRLRPANDKVALIIDSMASGFGINEEVIRRFQKSYHDIYAEMRVTKAAFVADYPDSYLSLDLVREQSAIIEYEKFGPLFYTLSERLRKTASANAMEARLEIAKKTAIGQPAMDFVLNDTTGTPLSLSSLKGKYVLVDFWASWCGPCRQENPYLVKAYEKFSNSGFQILSVSIDTQKPAWLKAIREDGLNWLHASDLKGGKGEVARMYDIRAVPQNFLVDPNGVIIAKNLRSQQLEEKLNEVLK